MGGVNEGFKKKMGMIRWLLLTICLYLLFNSDAMIGQSAVKGVDQKSDEFCLRGQYA